MRAATRREDARLGLFVLVYGLVLSPLVHAVVQHGGHEGAPRDAAWVTHGPGSHDPHGHGAPAHAHAHGGPAHAHAHGGPAHAHDAPVHLRGHGVPLHDAHAPSHGGPSHSHGEDSGTPGSHRHGHFSVEHLQAVLVPVAAPLLAVGLLLTLSWVLRGEERRESGSRLALHPAMPQGP
jgi:hypothetical protein